MDFLNKITVLDNGWVALLSASCTGNIIKEIQTYYYDIKPNRAIAAIPHATLVVRCPLFVQLYLANFDLTLRQLKGLKEKQLYVPTEVDIGAPELKDSISIRDHIKQTLEALVVSSEGYKMDGCNASAAQVVLPVSVYSDIMLSGSMAQWIEVLSHKTTTPQINQYKAVICNILLAEWPLMTQYVAVDNGKEETSNEAKSEAKG